VPEDQNRADVERARDEIRHTVGLEPTEADIQSWLEGERQADELLERARSPDREDRIEYEAQRLIREFGGFRRAHRHVNTTWAAVMARSTSDDDSNEEFAFWMDVSQRINELGRQLPWWRRILGF
jgi:hypothetical protein